MEEIVADTRHVEEPLSVPEARQLTRARARDIGSLLLRYGRRHLPKTAPRPPESPPEPPRATGTHELALRYLRLIPVVLIVLFGTSFLWDFDGLSTSIFGYQLQFEGLLRIMAVSGMIGFLTNWLAITMLFQPREKRPIFGQGLIPAQRDRVIFRLAQAVSTELINEEIIKEKIRESGVLTKYRDLGLQTVRGVVEDPEFREDLRGLVVDYAGQIVRSKPVRDRLVEVTVNKLEEHAGQGLGGMALRAYRYFNEKDFQERIDTAIEEFPTALDGLLQETDPFVDKLPERIEAHADNIERWLSEVVLGFVGRLDIYDMVLSNMQRYDEAQLERLLKTTSNEQLNYIKYLGGVLGVFGGLVIWEPLIALTAFALLGGTLYLIDEALYRRSSLVARRS